VTGEQTAAIAELAASYGGDIRLTRQQNFILTGVPEARVDEITARLAELGFPIDAGRLRGASVACTGQPLCNFAGRRDEDEAARDRRAARSALRRQGRRAEARRGRLPALLRPPLGHRHRAPGHDRARRRHPGQARGSTRSTCAAGLGENAAIGRPILRRVPAGEAPAYVERLVAGYLDERQDGETFQAFATRKTDDELITLASGRVAVAAANGGAS
jgi:ferredoxin-nitrite reductase